MTEGLQYGRCIGIGIVLLLMTTLVQGQSLSIGAMNSLPTFQLTADPTPESPLTVRANWIGSDRPTGQWIVAVCVSMNAPMVGTGSNTDTIPASAVQVNGTSIVSGATNCGFPNARLIGSKKHHCNPAQGCIGFPDEYTVNIRLAGYSPSLLPDAYTGTINLIAEAQY